MIAYPLRLGVAWLMIFAFSPELSFWITIPAALFAPIACVKVN